MDSKQATRVCRSCARPEGGSAEAEATVVGVKVGARGKEAAEGAEEVAAEIGTDEEWYVRKILSAIEAIS